jgi:hypothetical protein
MTGAGDMLDLWLASPRQALDRCVLQLGTLGLPLYSMRTRRMQARRILTCVAAAPWRLPESLWAPWRRAGGEPDR